MEAPNTFPSEGHFSYAGFEECTTTSDKIWSLNDLQVLHELRVPVAVIVPTITDAPHRPSGLLSSMRVVFQNAEFLRKYGMPLPGHLFSDYLDSMPEDMRKGRRDWIMKVMTGKGQAYRSRVDIHAMLRASFENVNETMPRALARLESKPIRMQTSTDKVELAVMHVLETDPSSADMAVMSQRNPLHTFMFDSRGKLLNANKAAFEAFQSDPPNPDLDRRITLKNLFDLGAYPGGQAEANKAYEEAYNDVFNLQLDCHRHAQPHRSRKDGSIKWDMIEMWPMQDPIDAGPAVLMKKYDITQQKDLELKLSIQQQELQRQNQELERYSASMLQDKLRLQEQADSLEQRLEAVLHDKFHAKAFDAETPIDKTIAYLHNVIKGETPPLQAALDLYHILSESDTDLRQPVGLKKQLLSEYSLDADVGQSMLQLLQGNNTAAPYKQTEESTPAQMSPVVAPPASSSPAAPRPLSSSTSSGGSLHNASTMMPMPAITPTLERQLQEASSSWQFDIFSFAEATPGHTLSLLAMHLFQQSNLVQHFQVVEPNLWHWVQRIEGGYNPNNPYHNSVHVASVLQMTHMLLTHGGIRQSKAMDWLEVYCAYWSAITHDFEHGGVNNDFLIRTCHPLAICYNDQSPLENHHLAAAVRTALQPEHCHVNPDRLPAGDWIQARRLCINMVLGTDMKKHFDIVSRFQAAFKKMPSSGNSEASGDLDWSAVKAEDKYLMHQMMLKCADIGHLAADVATHKRWAYQLEEEFFRQGDKERELGLTISPLMDRAHQGGMTRSQLGFLNIVGIPLFKAMAEVFEGAQPVLEGVMANYRQWEEAAAQLSDASAT